MSEHGLANKLGIGIDDAVDLMNQFRRTFPQMYEYMEIQSGKKKFVQTICGRKSWLNPYSEQCVEMPSIPTQGSGGIC